MIEFVALGLLLMLPVAYLVLVLGRIQAASFAANGAAREGARAFAAADSDAEAQRHLAITTELALRDHHFADEAGEVAISCTASPCLTPGERVTVEVQIAARFPWLPAGFADALNARVVVSASQAEVVDEFREAGP
ncbi:pilus assembly protein [Kineosporia babensis]|uniref:Pilus assembly protein n=1 Tax=Kineosporia babensis TaxID=499548 RepID=A0A9X1SXP0_9ACTN|nr:pilus assembly protein [Kineosporia babensis]MCD5315400.1 pilus assembly protein [Kineosporia babensis]